MTHPTHWISYPLDDTALALGARWAPHAEVVFARLVELSTSKHLTNPDALKVWLEGLALPAAAGDTFAARLNDAWDLVSAGHRVAVEETAKGTADVIDLDERVAYAYARVVSSHVAPALQQAARTLNGDGSSLRPGAPAGLTGVVHLDLRANAFAHALDDRALGELVATAGLRGRVDRVQLLLDDRVVTLDARGRAVGARDP